MLKKKCGVAIRLTTITQPEQMALLNYHNITKFREKVHLGNSSNKKETLKAPETVVRHHPLTNYYFIVIIYIVITDYR